MLLLLHVLGGNVDRQLINPHLMPKQYLVHYPFVVADDYGDLTGGDGLITSYMSLRK